MNATFKSFEDQLEIDLYLEIGTLIKKNPWAWQSVCAVIGLAGGVIAPILVVASDVIALFIHSSSVDSYLHVVSYILCALTILLLLLGASCLDLLEAKTSNLSPPASPPPAGAAPATALSHVARRTGNHRLNCFQLDQ